MRAEKIHLWRMICEKESKHSFRYISTLTKMLLFLNSVTLALCHKSQNSCSSKNRQTALAYRSFFRSLFAAGLLPLYSVLVRRMHDVGLNGILAFIPIAGFVLSLMPSAQESVYRTKKKVHPIAGTVGKIFLVLLTLSALNNVVTGIKNFHAGSGEEYDEYEYDGKEVYGD